MLVRMLSIDPEGVAAAEGGGLCSRAMPSRKGSRTATRLSPSRSATGSYLFVLLTVSGIGCAGSQGAKAGQDERKLEIEHEACDIDGGSAKKTDVNGDGRPDLYRVMSGNREVCRAIDPNFDGVKDAFIYYDEQGRERRRESDFDRDGRPDEVSVSENGVVVSKQRETNFDSKLDTWETYTGGRLAKAERDSDADGIIDEWWDFNRPDNPDCAVVVKDHNADGKPDPDSAVDNCGESYKAPPSPTLGAPTAAPSGTAPGDFGGPPPKPPATATGSAAPSAPAPAPSASAPPASPSASAPPKASAAPSASPSAQPPKKGP